MMLYLGSSNVFEIIVNSQEFREINIFPLVSIDLSLSVNLTFITLFTHKYSQIV